MPFMIPKVTDNLYSRIAFMDCWLCYNPMNVKVGDYVARKTTRKSRYAHLECAVKKNWITKDDIKKLYLVQNTSKT